MTLCQEDQKELSNAGGKKTQISHSNKSFCTPLKKLQAYFLQTFRAPSQDYRYLFIPKDHYNTPVSARVEDSRAYEREYF